MFVLHRIQRNKPQTPCQARTALSVCDAIHHTLCESRCTTRCASRCTTHCANHYNIRWLRSQVAGWKAVTIPRGERIVAVSASPMASVAFALGASGRLFMIDDEGGKGTGGKQPLPPDNDMVYKHPGHKHELEMYRVCAASLCCRVLRDTKSIAVMRLCAHRCGSVLGSRGVGHRIVGPLFGDGLC